MKETEHIERIERYVFAQMDTSERADMELTMLADEALRKEVAEYQQLFSGMEALRVETFMAQLKNWDKALVNGVSPETSVKMGKAINNSGLQKRNILFKVAAVALVLVLPLAAMLYMANNNRANPDQLFADFFSPAHNSVVNTLRTDTVVPELEQDIQDCMRSYDEGDFISARKEISDFLNEHPGQNRVYFHLGVSMLADHMSNEALEVFDNLRSLPDAYYVDDLDWYSALALLDLKRLDESKALLHKIAADPKQFHRHKASRLLESMK